ncbi:hypothetical protein OG539_40830 [Actinacidiphila glaucinigra]|uniref:hypothetical protein n=1 Tax=Actinacidiphila glaucinigra TaxID=235986 RepID=UPI002DD9786D|nr:hypothetical protein [Actinacidiphila glaucinigra]WSD57882.1 hypothetical protein OIE69_02665 [Actinacidiphila glaucinigra]
MPGPSEHRLSLEQRPDDHAGTVRPQPARLNIRHRGAFAYAAGEPADGEQVKLMRLRYTGTATTWGFALHPAGSDTYENTVLPTGSLAGNPTEALDCACSHLATPDV